MALLLKNGRIFTESGVLEGGYLLIDDGRISRIGNGGEHPRADEEVDVGGHMVSPGFIDIHTHGIFDIDFMESGVEDLDRCFEKYLQFGITRILATTLSNPLDVVIQQIQRIRQVKEKSPLGSLINGVHLEGPWLAWRLRGGHPEKYLRAPNPEDVHRLLGEVGDILSTVTFSPELDHSVWLCETLSVRGIVPVIGHTEASYKKTMDVIRGGARHVTHLFDGTGGFRESETEALTMEPGIETAVLISDEVSVELIGCPIHVSPPLFRLVDKIKPCNKKILVSDSLVGAGLPEGSVITFKDGRQAGVEDGVLRMIYKDDPELDHNLTGSAITLNIALKRLSRYIDEPLEKAVPWVTMNPALLLGISNDTGSIRVGKNADIAVFDEDVNVKMTILEGNIVYRQGA
jgi:N-acetylglucosamine-6-phosphate deacetylase